MPIVPNIYYREALCYGATIVRGILDASAPGSLLKPFSTPGIVDLASLFEWNNGYQNNGSCGPHRADAHAKAAAARKQTQPAAAGSPTPASGSGHAYQLPAATKEHLAISEEDYKKAASDIGVSDVAAVKAVAKTEGGGQAYLKDGRPLVRYEPHHFRKFTKGRYDKEFPHLSAPYSVVKKQHLSKGFAAAFPVLEQALKLDPEAAIMACAWGAFQVQGDIWKDAGFSTPYDMVSQVYQGLGGHFKLFVGYIKVNHLAGLLKNKDWAAFAKRYNGADYAVHHYDTVMQKNYESAAGAA